MKPSKRYKETQKLVNKNKLYGLQEAVETLKKFSGAKFDETVEVSFKLGVDPKKSDQLVRGTVILPHGTGKKVKVTVFCKGENERIAKEEGADFVGSEELIKKVNSGWLDFDVAIASPDMMKEISRLGRILGPRGLMPSVKAGTVTPDIKKAVSETKKGKVQFKVDKQADIHLGVGRISFQPKALSENIRSLIKAVIEHKPSHSKGQYIKSMSLSTTMGSGIRLDVSSLK
ncbi:MAG: 50S ribosomal protein L1 [Candidatus Omnitrophota bacterium]|nr:50S ribosomal protein L1 [Candidatus Omnitrophota bacterium]